MAAQPPKPPGNFLNKNKTHNSNSNNNTNNNNNRSDNQTNQVNLIKPEKSAENKSGERVNESVAAAVPPSENGENLKQATNCNCTNISIMHLFHEMKQKFPTLPDQLVAECVSDNCHQRENCIKTLSNELALHPTPAQSYPAKILSTRPKPATPLKPVRAAPLKPPLQQTPPTEPTTTNNAPMRVYVNYDKADLMPLAATDVKSTINNYNNNINNNNNNNNNNNSNSNCINNIEKNSVNSDTETTTTTNNNNSITNTATIDGEKKEGEEAEENCENSCLQSKPLPPPPPPPLPKQLPPRLRPTTLNLHTHQQKKSQSLSQQQQRPTTLDLNTQQLKKQQLLNHHHQQQQQHRLNIQLEQRMQTQQSQTQQPTRPIRKAPQPPLPPKPTQYSHNNSYHSPPYHSHHNNTKQQNGNNILTQSQQSSFSNESTTSSCLTSPICSTESELSVNVALSSPTAIAASAAAQQPPQPHTPTQTTSIRRRAVITVHPEPPYMRDILPSPTSSTGSGKSFTSVNLTLRQPNANAAGLPASTIDISAGPVNSGIGSGLTYSSTSYDSRLGFKKNFHISVSDEGSVVSATSLRPSRVHFQANNEQQQLDDFKPTSNGSAVLKSNAYQSNGGEGDSDGSGSGVGGVGVGALLNSAECKPDEREREHTQLQLRYSQLRQQDEEAEQRQHRLREQQQQQQQQQNYQNPVTFNTKLDTEMCCKNLANDFAEKITKQKQCRDYLAAQLRKQKNELRNLKQEIDILADPVDAGDLERLDIEIENLRRECQTISAQVSALPPTTITHANASPSTTSASTLSSAHTSPTAHQQPQPFPRQRTSRTVQQQHHYASSTNSLPRQGPLDFVQHHSGSATSPQQQMLLQQQHNLLQQHQQQLQGRTFDDDMYYADSPSEDSADADDVIGSGDDDNDEENLEPWACNLCTFRNHPQLNICEACENVRILPGTIRIVQSAGAAAAAAAAPPASASATNSLEHETQLTQQQFALHT